SKLCTSELIWFHGASVGEINGLVPLINKLREYYPRAVFLLTATSATGLERGKQFVDHAFLLPFDCKIWLERALAGLKFKLAIFTETELWPAALFAARAHSEHVYLV